MLIAIVIAIFWIFGYPPTIYMLQLPVYILLAFAFCTAWGSFASYLGAMSKDFCQLIKSLMTAVFWLSGIMWNANTITIGWIKKFLMVNPVTFIVNGFRNCFINNVWIWEQPKRLLYFAVILLALVLLGQWARKKLKKEIADVL